MSNCIIATATHGESGWLQLIIVVMVIPAVLLAQLIGMIRTRRRQGAREASRARFGPAKVLPFIRPDPKDHSG